MAATYDRVRVLFPDHLGLARGKYLPIEHADRGTAHCISLFSLGFDREMTPHEGAANLSGLPDCDLTFTTDEVRHGWETDTALVVGDLSRNGRPLEMAPREVLKRQIAAWREHGYEPKIGIELEAYASTDVVVPASLGEALDALEADKEPIEAFSPAFVDGFLTTKRAGGSRFLRHTTDWELEEYLPFL